MSVPQEAVFLFDWAGVYAELQSGDVRYPDPSNHYEHRLPTQCKIIVPLLTNKLVEGTDWPDPQFVPETLENEPIVATFIPENATLILEIQDYSMDATRHGDDLGFRLYREGLFAYLDMQENPPELRILPELEDELLGREDPIDLTELPDYERTCRFATHIVSHTYDPGNKQPTLTFGLVTSLETLEHIFEIIPHDASLYGGLSQEAGSDTRWGHFVSYVLSKAADRIAGVYPYLSLYGEWWYSEGQFSSAYEHMRAGQASVSGHNVFDEAMEITHGQWSEHSRWYRALAKKRLEEAGYWYTEWALDALEGRRIRAARFPDPVFEEPASENILVISVPLERYNIKDGEIGTRAYDEELWILCDNDTMYMEVGGFNNFGLPTMTEAEFADFLESWQQYRPGRATFYYSNLQHTTSPPYLAFGIQGGPGEDADGMLDEIRDAFKDAWYFIGR